MTTVGLVGASGFVGSATARALRESGFHVRAISAPRLRTAARDTAALRSDAGKHEELGKRLVAKFRDCDVVVNAAGVANATAEGGDELFGANSLLPCVLSRAAEMANVDRFIQISSAAVQGNMDPLDESAVVKPFSAYSRSKALGEQAILGPGRVVVFRPTSVHGPDRDATRSLVALARSPWSCVAGDGQNASPQVHIRNVAAALAYIVNVNHHPPSIVLQPSECWTASSFLRALSGREPHHIPELVARGGVALARQAGRSRPGWAGYGRRLELLLFGQAQAQGWLDREPFSGPAGRADWQEMATSIRDAGGIRP